MDRFHSELRAPQPGEKQEVIYPESAKSVWTRVKDVYHGEMASTALQLWTNPLNLASHEYWHGQPLKYGVRPDQVFDSFGNFAQTAVSLVPAWGAGKSAVQTFRTARALKSTASAQYTRAGLRAVREAAESPVREKLLQAFNPHTWATPARWLGKKLFNYAGPSAQTNPFGAMAYDALLVGLEWYGVKRAARSFSEVRDGNMKAEAGAAAPVGGPPPVVPPAETNAPPVKVAAPMDVAIADSVVRQAYAESGGDTNKFAEAVAKRKIPKEVLDGVRSNRYAGFFRKRNGIPLSLVQKTLDNTTDEKKRADLTRMLQESEVAFGALDSNAQLTGGN